MRFAPALRDGGFGGVLSQGCVRRSGLHPGLFSFSPYGSTGVILQGAFRLNPGDEPADATKAAHLAGGLCLERTKVTECLLSLSRRRRARYLDGGVWGWRRCSMR